MPIYDVGPNMPGMAKCSVTFTESPQGPSAILWHKGHSINLRNYPRGYVLTANGKARARKSLMKGCTELARESDRVARRRRRQHGGD